MLHRFEQFVSYISAIHRDIQRIEREEMEKLGLKGAYAQYLVAMQRYPEGITAADLCEVCDKDKAAVSRAVTEMEKHGLLHKLGSRENQYRAMLRLTEKGRHAAEYVCTKAISAVQIAADGIDEETRTALYRALRSVSRQMQFICREGLPE
ncbi:MAG: MarR family transcriptional regulator [Oscillospiraceae bacterium]|nr:MarR family transcriptional regulator [Oscillospiraceae bacterium]